MYSAAMQVYRLVSCLKQPQARQTYNTDGANKLLGRFYANVDNVADKIGSNGDDDEHGKPLHDADKQEGLAQRHGTVAWNRHFGWC